MQDTIIDYLKKSFLVRAIDEGEQKNKNIKINNFFILKGAFCCRVREPN